MKRVEIELDGSFIGEPEFYDSSTRKDFLKEFAQNGLFNQLSSIQEEINRKSSNGLYQMAKSLNRILISEKRLLNASVLLREEIIRILDNYLNHPLSFSDMVVPTPNITLTFSSQSKESLKENYPCKANKHTRHILPLQILELPKPKLKPKLNTLSIPKSPILCFKNIKLVNTEQAESPFSKVIDSHTSINRDAKLNQESIKMFNLKTNKSSEGDLKNMFPTKSSEIKDLSPDSISLKLSSNTQNNNFNSNSKSSKKLHESIFVSKNNELAEKPTPYFKLGSVTSSNKEILQNDLLKRLNSFSKNFIKNSAIDSLLNQSDSKNKKFDTRDQSLNNSTTTNKNPISLLNKKHQSKNNINYSLTKKEHHSENKPNNRNSNFLVLLNQSVKNSLIKSSFKEREEKVIQKKNINSLKAEILNFSFED